MKIKLWPIIKSITIALVFFALGRLMVARMGNAGIWIIVIALIIFYAFWWNGYQKNKQK